MAASSPQCRCRIGSGPSQASFLRLPKEGWQSPGIRSFLLHTTEWLPASTLLSPPNTAHTTDPSSQTRRHCALWQHILLQLAQQACPATLPHLGILRLLLKQTTSLGDLPAMLSPCPDIPGDPHYGMGSTQRGRSICPTWKAAVPNALGAQLPAHCKHPSPASAGRAQHSERPCLCIPPSHHPPLTLTLSSIPPGAVKCRSHTVSTGYANQLATGLWGTSSKAIPTPQHQANNKSFTGRAQPLFGIGPTPWILGSCQVSLTLDLRGSLSSCQ